MKGRFLKQLNQSNSEIKKNRAISIAEKTQCIYKRKIEDLEIEIKELERNQKDALDLSPTNALSLQPAKDFSEEKFYTDDLNYSIQIREKKIEKELAEERYKYLFEEEVDEEK